MPDMSGFGAIRPTPQFYRPPSHSTPRAEPSEARPQSQGPKASREETAELLVGEEWGATNNPYPAEVPFIRRRMGLSRERRGDDSPPTAIRLSPVPHHAFFEGFGAGVAKGDSGPIHRSLENGGFRDPCFATPRDVKAHIAWCGSLLCHTMRFWGVFRLVWHTGWERISRTDG